MKISKNSWHYKLVRKWDYDVPNTSCAYIRRLLAVLLFGLLIGVMCLLIASVTVVPLIITVLYHAPLGVVPAKVAASAAAALVAWLGFGGVVLFLFGLINGLYWLSEKRNARHEARAQREVFSPNDSENRNGLLQGLKDFHNKTCTRIEYKD